MSEMLAQRAVVSEPVLPHAPRPCGSPRQRRRAYATTRSAVTLPIAWLLADAELGEDGVEDVLAGDEAGDGTEVLERVLQVDGDDIGR